MVAGRGRLEFPGGNARRLRCSGYSANLGSNLTSLSTSGLVVNYTSDVLNRLSTVAEPSTTTTNYAYDAAGNLASFGAHNYTYDSRNRLANLTVGNVASYAYTLDDSGHRTQVVEKSGRTVNYSYDSIYRLTSETVAGIGAVSYTYDPVGNRKTLTSTLAPIQSATSSFDNNDRLSSDTYDSNGNTTQSAGSASGYDFENHLTSSGGIVSMVYDGDGNRVRKTVNGVATTYLVDDLNPTGYAQVLKQTTGAETRQFVYGLERISQRRNSEVRYYAYDGHGSVRLLTDTTGTVTDTYDYDAFGNIVNSTGVTPNEFLFAGEQFDSDLGLYYNRARYLNATTGRFWNMDSYEGDPSSPGSLHKYLYVNSDPVGKLDPSGHDGFAAESLTSLAALGAFVTLAVASLTILRGLQPAAVDAPTGSTGEVDPTIPGFVSAAAQAALLLFSLKDAIERAKDLAKDIARGLRRQLPPKIVPLPEDIIPYIYLHVLVAQASGHPSVLTRTHAAQAIRNRAKALGGLPWAGPGLSWDEYPFASSAQGGYGASVRAVPLYENFVQGGIIAASYFLENISVGDDFLVVPLPKLPRVP